MAHAFSAAYVHLVFSTKERVPFLKDEVVRQDVHRYMAGIAANRDAKPLIVGGIEDHVHLLVHLGRTISIADLVRDLKRGSTVWIKQEHPGLTQFAWQSGYAALSVGHREIDVVRGYIARQAEHHAINSFQAEYRELLTEHGIQLDERYMWE